MDTLTKIPLKVTIQWPPRELNPNTHCHWRVKAKTGKNYKRDVFYLCKLAGFTKLDNYEKLHVWLDFFPPSNHKIDQDNALASCKHMLDGIAEALGVDDSKFVLHPFFHEEIGGKVVVQITTYLADSDIDILERGDKNDD